MDHNTVGWSAEQIAARLSIACIQVNQQRAMTPPIHPFVTMEAFPAVRDSNPNEYPGNSFLKAIIAPLEMGDL